MSDDFKETVNTVVVLQANQQVTLTADQELVAAGTVQVASNAEVSGDVAVKPSNYTSLTTHTIT